MADMEEDKVSDKVPNPTWWPTKKKMANMVVNIVTNIEKIDIDIIMEIQFCEKVG